MDHARVGRAGHIAGRNVEVLSGCSAARYPAEHRSGDSDGPLGQRPRPCRPHTVSGGVGGAGGVRAAPRGGAHRSPLTSPPPPVAPHALVPPQGRKAARSTLASAHLAISPAAATKEVASAAQTKPVRLVWEPRAVPLSPALLATPKPTSLRLQAPPGSDQRPSRAPSRRAAPP